MADPAQASKRPIVAILGTSNGIIADGYQRALRDRRGTIRVQVLALGASPCSFLHYRLSGVERGQFEFGLIETLVNDAASVRRRAFSVAMMEDALRSAIDRLRALGSTPIALMLPGGNLDESTLAVAAAQSRVFNEAGVRHCNFLSLLEVLGDRTGASFQSFFRDPAHMLSAVSYLIAGEFFGSALASRETAPFAPAVERYGFVSVSACRFQPAGGTSLPCGPLKRIATSLLDDVSFVLPEGAELHVPCDPESVLAALVVNIKNTNCILRIRGASVLEKDFRFEVDPQDTKVIVSACVEGVPGGETGLTLSTDGHLGRGLQPTYFTDLKSTPRNRLELLGFILRRGTTDGARASQAAQDTPSSEWQPDPLQMQRIVQSVGEVLATGPIA